jgi:uncharacterized protein YndB with AHSA1/START domain
MAGNTVRRTVAAPVGRVFEVVTDIEAYPDNFPSVTKIEFIGEQRNGVGTRFSETRFASGRDGTSEAEVTEYLDGDHIRLQDKHLGSAWDTTYTVEDDGGSTRLTMTVNAEPHKLMANVLGPHGPRGRDRSRHVNLYRP